MVMTIGEYNIALNNLIRDCQTKQGIIMARLGSDAISLIKQRVTETGVNAKGVKFAPYSNLPMLSGCSNFINKKYCQAFIGSKTKQREQRKRTQFERFMAASAGEHELKWVTLKRGGKNIRLFEIPGGYKQFRELNKRRTDIVNFSLTGRMWSNIFIVSGKTEHDKGIVKISAKTEEDNKKLEGNTKRRGDILDLSISEQNTLKDIYSLEVLNIIKQNGLQ